MPRPRSKPPANPQHQFFKTWLAGNDPDVRTWIHHLALTDTPFTVVRLYGKVMLYTHRFGQRIGTRGHADGSWCCPS